MTPQDHGIIQGLLIGSPFTGTDRNWDLATLSDQTAGRV